MDELRDRADSLQQENDHLQTRLEKDRGENARESSHLAPLIKQNRDKEPILPSDNDAIVDDKLSSGSSPLPDLLPPNNNVEAEPRKSPPRRSNHSISSKHRRVQREINRER